MIPMVEKSVKNYVGWYSQRIKRFDRSGLDASIMIIQLYILRRTRRRAVVAVLVAVAVAAVGGGGSGGRGSGGGICYLSSLTI